jgi:hypothetical protein
MSCLDNVSDLLESFAWGIRAKVRGSVLDDRENVL